MLAEDYGKLIRETRLRKGVKQQELASRAQVSRAVVSKLEQGKQPVQTDTLDRLLAALEVRPAIDSAGGDSLRKLARLEEEIKRLKRRERHLRLAVQLAGSGASTEALVTEARRQVEIWQRNRTCSPFYIEQWTRILSLPGEAMAKELTSLGEWEDALFQNSPWPHAWN